MKFKTNYIRPLIKKPENNNNLMENLEKIASKRPPNTTAAESIDENIENFVVKQWERKYKNPTKR